MQHMIRPSESCKMRVGMAILLVAVALGRVEAVQVPPTHRVKTLSIKTPYKGTALPHRVTGGDDTPQQTSPHTTSGPGGPTLYPLMMWHSWGLFTHEDEVNEANMKEMGDALVSSGMADAGYATLNVVRA